MKIQQNKRARDGDAPGAVPFNVDASTTTPIEVDGVEVIETLAGPRRTVECALSSVPVEMRRDSDLVWRGTEYQIDLTKAQAWSGLQWSRGDLRLEQNPALYPVFARGYGMDPGKFFALKNIAIIEAALEDMAAAVTSATYRVEDQDVPRWHRGKSGHELAAERQSEFAARLWWEWNRPDRKTGFLQWAGDWIRTAPVAGFCLHEIVYRPVWWQLPGDVEPTCYWIPEIEWRAPWSVYKWAIQGNDPIPVGVILTSSFATDTDGRRGPLYTPLDRRKFLHVVARDLGRNPEGRSHLRSAWTPANKLSINNQVEGLSNEVNGLGTWIAKPGPNGWQPGHAEALDEHLLNYKAGHVPFIRLDDPDVSLDIISPNSQVKDFTAVINRDTQAVLMALNSEDKLIGTTKQGSHAARETAADDSWKPYGVAARDYVAAPAQELMARALHLNFPLDVVLGRMYAPRVKVGAIEREDATAKIANLVAAKTAELLEDPRYEVAARAAIPELG